MNKPGLKLFSRGYASLTVPEHEACTRFRMFFSNDYQTIPQSIVDVIPVCGSYDHRDRREVHYQWPEGHPVQEALHERLSGPAEAVAPDGAERATFATDWSSTRTHSRRTISSLARSVPSQK